MHCVVLVAAALAFGVFCPSIAAKLKKDISKETTAGKTAVTSAVSTAVSAEAKKL
jgi:hypothetical protein